MPNLTFNLIALATQQRKLRRGGGIVTNSERFVVKVPRMRTEIEIGKLQKIEARAAKNKKHEIKNYL